MLFIRTFAASDFTQFGPGTVSFSLTGQNIISVGCQTAGNQQKMAVVQAFVAADGTTAYLQVANNDYIDSIGVKWWTVHVAELTNGSELVPPSAEINFEPKTD